MLWRMKKKTEEHVKEKEPSGSGKKGKGESDKELRSSGEKKGKPSSSKMDMQSVKRRPKSVMPHVHLDGLPDWEIESPRQESPSKITITKTSAAEEGEEVNQETLDLPTATSNDGIESKREGKDDESGSSTLLASPVVKKRSNSMVERPTPNKMEPEEEQEQQDHEGKEEQEAGGDGNAALKNSGDGLSQLKLISNYNLKELRNEPGVVRAPPPLSVKSWL